MSPNELRLPMGCKVGTDASDKVSHPRTIMEKRRRHRSSGGDKDLFGLAFTNSQPKQMRVREFASRVLRQGIYRVPILLPSVFCWAATAISMLK